jgi:hypothetical protein
MKIHHYTMEQMRRGITLPTGERHRIVVPRPKVLLEVEWDADVVAELPDDLALSLKVGGEVQRQKLQNGYRRRGRVGVAFRWVNVDAPTSMQTSTGGEDSPLWEGRVIGREPGLGAIADLIEPADEPEAEQDSSVQVIATLEPGPREEPPGRSLDDELPAGPGKEILT